MERCELWRNAKRGVTVFGGGNPHLTLAACTLRDHAAGNACGVYLWTRSSATVEADCVFARNAGGNVVLREADAME